MSCSYYKMEFKPDENFLTCIELYKNSCIFRVKTDSKLWVYHNRDGEFVKTEWENIEDIVGTSKWYISHEKISRQTAFRIINKMKMIKSLGE